MHQSHTSTGQWQSFELRMRQRRVQRCISRASEALDARRVDAARAALDEAYGLFPDSQDVRELAARVAAAERQAPAPRARSGRYARFAPAAVLLIILAAVGWLRSGWTDTTGMRPSDVPIATRPPAPIPFSPAQAAMLPAIEVAAPQPPVVDETPRESVVERTATESARRAARTTPPARDAATRTSGTRADVTSALGGTSTALSSRTAPETRADGSPSPASATGRATASLTAVPTPPDLPAVAAAPPPGDTPASGLPPRSEPVVVAAPAPVAAESAAAAAAAVHERQVRDVLNRYQAAYSDLDAAAAGAVWPSVDRRALARAFDGLAAQRVSLGQCAVRVNGTAATADCTGQARWTPKVGGGPQTAARRWQFQLTQAGDEWIITQANVR